MHFLSPPLVSTTLIWIVEMKVFEALGIFALDSGCDYVNPFCLFAGFIGGLTGES